MMVVFARFWMVDFGYGGFWTWFKCVEYVDSGLYLPSIVCLLAVTGRYTQVQSDVGYFGKGVTGHKSPDYSRFIERPCFFRKYAKRLSFNISGSEFIGWWLVMVLMGLIETLRTCGLFECFFWEQLLRVFDFLCMPI